MCATVAEILSYTNAGMESHQAFGNHMTYFFELCLSQPLGQLPPEASLSIQQIQTMEVAGRHYSSIGDGTWVKFATILSPGVAVPARVSAIYTVNNVYYLVFQSYGKFGMSLDGLLHVAASQERHEPIVALSDMLFINPLWVHHAGVSEGTTFIEMPM